MKKPTLVLFIFLISTLVSSAQSAKKLECKLVIPKDTIGALDPFRMRIRVINHGRKAFKTTRLQFYPQSFDANLSMQYQREGETEWEKFVLPIRQNDDIELTSQNIITVIPPHDSLETEEVVFPLHCGIDNPAENGDYLLTVDYLPFKFTTRDTLTRVRSKNIRLHVASYNGTADDSACYHYLKTLARPDFVFDAYYRLIFANVCVTENLFALKNASEAEAILARYPASKFARWANLYLYVYYYDKAFEIGTQRNFTNIEEVLDQLFLSSRHRTALRKINDPRIMEQLENVDYYLLLREIYKPLHVPGHVAYRLGLNN